MIEDELILSLRRYGFHMVERDENMILRMVREKKGRTYSASLHPDSMGFTHLDPADFQISYRVLETGLKYWDVSSWKAKLLPMFYDRVTMRRSFSKLHVRVQNTATGDIIYAGNLASEKEDKVFTKYFEELNNYHYKFLTNDYPLQSIDDDDDKSDKVLGDDKKRRKKFLWIF